MTPGTLTDDPLLDGRSGQLPRRRRVSCHARPMAIAPALAWVELSTGELRRDERQRRAGARRDRAAAAGGDAGPRAAQRPAARDRQGDRSSWGSTRSPSRPGWQFTPHHAAEQIQQAVAVNCRRRDSDSPTTTRPSSPTAAVLAYLEETQKTGLAHIRPLRRHVVEDHLAIDPASWRSLEIDRTVRSGGTEGTLLSAIDRTRTAWAAGCCGSGCARRCAISSTSHARQSAIAALLESPATLKCDRRMRWKTSATSSGSSAASTVGRASPRDLAALGKCLDVAAGSCSISSKRCRMQKRSRRSLRRSRPFCAEQATYLDSAIMPDPAPHLREGGVIADGFDAELDRLRDIGTNSQQWLAKYQAQLDRRDEHPDA